MNDKTKLHLSHRAETLLQALIRRYVDAGEPVGSRTLSREVGIELSAATIRNVMADLEELGLIHAPHTSAGRVPTPLGYRVFVDTMLKIKPLKGDALNEISGNLQEGRDPNQLVELASDLLSQITHFAGVVMLPAGQHAHLKQVEFLRLSPGRVLAEPGPRSSHQLAASINAWTSGSGSFSAKNVSYLVRFGCWVSVGRFGSVVGYNASDRETFSPDFPIRCSTRTPGYCSCVI